MADKIKLVLAFLLVVAGVVGFYWLADHAAALRAVVVLVSVLAALAVARFTAPGEQAFVFCKESWTETKRVVWPTRSETLRTTGVVFLLVVVIAIFLWIVDASLMTMVKLLMGKSD